MTLEIAEEPVAPAGLNAAELKRELATAYDGVADWLREEADLRRQGLIS